MKRSALVVALLAFSLSCGRERTAPPTAPGSADGPPQEGGTVIRSLETEIATLNPLLASTKYDRYVANYLFTPLLYLDENLRPVAGLAEKWEISDDGKEYTFFLEENATFADGRPVRAADVVFTVGRIKDPSTQAAQFAAAFEKVDMAKTRVVDEHTVVIAFTETLATQLVKFNELLVLPEHVYGKGNFANDFNSTAVGSGPYRLVSAEPGKDIVLERRTDYWGDKPYIQRVVFKTIVDANTAWNALKHGDIDETTINSDIWQRESSRPDLKRTIDFRRFYTLAYSYIAWNGRNPLFADKRVRRALGMCVDLPSIIKNLYHGTARAMNGPFTPDEYAYNPAVPVLEYDPTRAKQILQTAGWFDRNGDGVLEKDGKPFEFEMYIFAGSATGLPFAQLVQEELRKIGVTMKITQLDPATMFDRVLAGNFQSAYLSWQLDPEPDIYPILHSSQVPPGGQNFVFYSNPVADRLMEQGRRQIDYSKRQQIYQELHKVLADDQPYTWVVQVSEKWALNRRIQGARESRGFGLFTWYRGEFDWWIPLDARRPETPRAKGGG